MGKGEVMDGKESCNSGGVGEVTQMDRSDFADKHVSAV